ncbi:hypothetical protein FNS94_06675 [Salmonella enterica]|nr:hypothetical protein [Salmonella enterica]
MIITNTTTLGALTGQPEPNLAELISGLFGLFHVKDAPVCENLDAAMTGYMKITPDSKSNPQSGELAYGNLQTWDSLGCGDSGVKVIPPVGGATEWIIQIAFMADGSLLTRSRVNNGAFRPWIRRW